MMLTIREPPAEGKKQFCLRETPVSGGSQGPGLSKQTTLLFGRVGRVLLQPQPWKGRVSAAGLSLGVQCRDLCGKEPSFPSGSWVGKNRSGALNYLSPPPPRVGGVQTQAWPA